MVNPITIAMVPIMGPMALLVSVDSRKARDVTTAIPRNEKPKAIKNLGSTTFSGNIFNADL
jgi:hypothetical protein